MDPKIVKLLLSVVAAIVLWVVGGFILGKAIGMACVMLGIILVGKAAGDVMNTPCPQHDSSKQ